MNPGQAQQPQQVQQHVQPSAQPVQNNAQQVPQQDMPDEPEDLTTAQMPPPPPLQPRPAMQATPPRPSTSQLSQDIKLQGNSVTIRGNAEKRGIAATVGLTGVVPVQPTNTTAGYASGGSGSSELATLQTVDMAALPPSWDTVGPPTPGAMKLPSPSQSLQTLMESASYSPFEREPAKQYSPGGLVAGSNMSQDEDVEVTGDL